MDISNIALVRATDVIPFDGIVKPISEVPYLKKNTSSKFAFAMNDLLRKVGKMPPITFEIMEEDIKNRQEILKKYIPYTSDYNSMVLWSINGLVPDDSENGFGKRTDINEYRTQIRAGKGIKTYNIAEKTGKLVGAEMVNEDDEMMIINSDGVLIRLRVNEISLFGRVTSGVKLMKTDDEVNVVSISKIKMEEE